MKQVFHTWHFHTQLLFHTICLPPSPLSFLPAPSHFRLCFVLIGRSWHVGLAGPLVFFSMFRHLWKTATVVPLTPLPVSTSPKRFQHDLPDLETDDSLLAGLFLSPSSCQIWMITTCTEQTDVQKCWWTGPSKSRTLLCFPRFGWFGI